jgi:hypothetical protein
LFCQTVLTHVNTRNAKGGLEMGQRIRVKAIRKEQPDIRLYVSALIALARQFEEENERQAAGSQSPEALSPTGEEVAHGRG